MAPIEVGDPGFLVDMADKSVLFRHICTILNIYRHGISTPKDALQVFSKQYVKSFFIIKVIRSMYKNREIQDCCDVKSLYSWEVDMT